MTLNTNATVDWREGTVLSSFALGDQSGQMSGTWNLVR
jgi:hypothetical protein